MKNNSTIRVKSTKDSDDDIIELITEGAFYYKNGSWYIMYEENEEMGMANCTVMVKINETEVIVSRKGDFSSKMIYKQGVTTEFLYHMPYGTIPLVLDTQKIDFSFDDDGGKLKMVYYLSVNENDDKNILTINVKKNS